MDRYEVKINVGDMVSIETLKEEVFPGEVIGKVGQHIIIRPEEQDSVYGKGNELLNENLCSRYDVDFKHVGCRWGNYHIKQDKERLGDWLPVTSISQESPNKDIG